MTGSTEKKQCFQIRRGILSLFGTQDYQKGWAKLFSCFRATIEPLEFIPGSVTISNKENATVAVKLIMLNYTYCHPEKIEMFEDDEPLWDIDVEEDHSFLIEGGYVVHNSAGGTAISARDRTFQAVLPLRGKVLNVHKSTLNEALENKEIGALVTALGVHVTHRETMIDSLRYHKVIMACHTGETKIPLLNGSTHTIKELSEGKAGSLFWVYSADSTTGRMQPGLAYMPRETRKAKELVEIEFEDGLIERCSLDHKWIRPNGSEVRADDLKVGDDFMSISRRLSNKGYEKAFNPATSRSNKLVHTHTLVTKDTSVLEEDRHCNHTVVSVRIVHLDQPESLYNMTVLGWGNYMIDNGVVSRNCDADPDGGHITCLLMTLFYKHMRKLVDEGHLYICDLPLYRVVLHNGKSQYLKDDEALENWKSQNPNTRFDVKRFKGLGEMNVDEFEECAMSPNTRRLKRIYVEDYVAAEEILTSLMGEKVESRKEFLLKALRFVEEESTTHG